MATCHDANYKALADLTWDQNRKLYCDRWNIEAFVKTDNFNTSIPIGFERCFLIKEIMSLNQHEYVFWTGTDVMITNHAIPLNQFIYDGFTIVIGCDFNEINDDLFLIKNDQRGKDFIDMMIDNLEKYRYHPYKEQGIIIDKSKEPNTEVKVLPQSFINSYHYPLYCPYKGARNHNDYMGFNGNWKFGDFAIHCPDQNMETRLNLFNQILPLVIK